MSPALRYPLVLGLTCVVAASVLGLVHEVTAEPIAQARRQQTLDALRTVLPAFDRVAEPAELRGLLAPSSPAAPSVDLFAAYQAGALVGVAVPVVEKSGYGGDISLMVGFGADGAVHAVKVLRHQETPGLGDKIGAPAFIDQFRSYRVPERGAAVKKDGGDLDAITGATISARAVAHAVNDAAATYRASVEALRDAPAGAGGGHE